MFIRYGWKEQGIQILSYIVRGVDPNHSLIQPLMQARPKRNTKETKNLGLQLQDFRTNFLQFITFLQYILCISHEFYVLCWFNLCYFIYALSLGWGCIVPWLSWGGFSGGGGSWRKLFRTKWVEDNISYCSTIRFSSY